MEESVLKQTSKTINLNQNLLLLDYKSKLYTTLTSSLLQFHSVRVILRMLSWILQSND